MLFVTIECGTDYMDNPIKPELRVSEDNRYIVSENGEPFLWLGGTAWSMTEWLSREGVDLFLDDRKSKGFNLVQICLF